MDLKKEKVHHKLDLTQIDKELDITKINDQLDISKIVEEIEDDTYEVDLNNNDISIDKSIPLDECIATINEIMDKFLNNEISEAKREAEEYCDTSMYHSLAKSFINFLVAIITFDPDEISFAQSCLKKTSIIASKYRRTTSIMKSISNLLRWKSVDYSSYTDSEAHAELIYAEVQLCQASTSLLGERSVLSLVKAGLRLNTANQTYKTCKEILQAKKDWNSSFSYENFRAGYLFGNGIFNLYLSHLPSKVLTLLPYIGLSGDYFTAVNNLQEVCDQLKSSMRSKICQICTLFYSLYIECVFGIESKSKEWTEKQVCDLVSRYPKGAIPLLFRGRQNMINGYPDLAIKSYNECLSSINDWTPLISVCYWDISWCIARKCDWLLAADYTQKVNKYSTFSPAVISYQYATFLLMYLDSGKCIPTEVDSLKAKIFEAFEKVPQQRIRYAGKTMPMEKFCVTRAQQYIDGESELVVAAIELYYVWNLFSHNCVNSNKPFLDIIESKLADESVSLIDDRCLLIFLKAVILSSSGSPFESIEYFHQVLNAENEIERDQFLPPHACFELGWSYAKAGQIDDAKIWLEKARSNYTGFLIETMVHLKVHTALLSLKRYEITGESDTIASSKKKQLIKTMSTITDESLNVKNKYHQLKRHKSYYETSDE